MLVTFNPELRSRNASARAACSPRDDCAMKGSHPQRSAGRAVDTAAAIRDAGAVAAMAAAPPRKLLRFIRSGSSRVRERLPRPPNPRRWAKERSRLAEWLFRRPRLAVER